MHRQAIAIALLALSGCATIQPDSEWHLTRQAIPVKEIAYSFTPCGKAWDGCFDRNTGIIWIKPNIADEQCVITHEKTHALGYDHGDEIAFVRNCGLTNKV